MGPDGAVRATGHRGRETRASPDVPDSTIVILGRSKTTNGIALSGRGPVRRPRELSGPEAGRDRLAAGSARVRGRPTRSLGSEQRGRPGTGSRSWTAITWPGRSTGTRSFATSGPGPCQGRLWSCSTRRRCWSPTCPPARTATPRSGPCWEQSRRRSDPARPGSPTEVSARPTSSSASATVRRASSFASLGRPCTSSGSSSD
jgi:hypothetical protein